MEERARQIGATPDSIRLTDYLGYLAEVQSIQHQNFAPLHLCETFVRGTYRNSRRRIFPTLVLGSSVRNSTAFGTL